MSIDTPAPVRPRQAPPPGKAAAPCGCQESQPRSAELLRLVLAWMGKHGAAFNPVAFAFRYEHVAGINLRFSQAIEQCLQTEPRLGDATVYRLYREHITDVDEAPAAHVSGGFRRVMQGLAQSVTVSSGVAVWQAGDDAAALIGRADAALYRAKQAGRDLVLRAALC